MDKARLAARLRRIADTIDPQPEPYAPFVGGHACAWCGGWVAWGTKHTNHDCWLVIHTAQHGRA